MGQEAGESSQQVTYTGTRRLCKGKEVQEGQEMTTQKTVRGQGLNYVSGWTWGAQLRLHSSKARGQPSTPRADISGGDAEAEPVKTTQEPVSLTCTDTISVKNLQVLRDSRSGALS